MVQVSERVGSAMNGSMKALAGSGMASMSEASMDFQPRMLEPSKPRPSLKESSDSSAMGMVKCCQVPKVSTNLTSTILAPDFLACSRTPLGVASIPVTVFDIGDVLLLLVVCRSNAWPIATPGRIYWPRVRSVIVESARGCFFRGEPRPASKRGAVLKKFCRRAKFEVKSVQTRPAVRSRSWRRSMKPYPPETPAETHH